MSGSFDFRHDSSFEFLLPWKGSCRSFAEDIKFSEKAKGRVRMYVFLDHNTPENVIPPKAEWIEYRSPLTIDPKAMLVQIACFVGDRLRSGRLKHPDHHFCIITESDEALDEVVALLRRGIGDSSVHEVNGASSSILDIVPSSCSYCRTVFADQREYDDHIRQYHDYFCDNPHCRYHKRPFRTKMDLDQHLVSRSRCHDCGTVLCSMEEALEHRRYHHQQPGAELSSTLSCAFCPTKSFQTSYYRDLHMRLCHKRCNCPCGQFFRNRDDYLAHFYSVYPLPCYENRKCPERFRNVLSQADHHVNAHNAIAPFYCVACYKRSVRKCFKDVEGLKIHNTSMMHEEEEVYLPVASSVSHQQDMAELRKSWRCSAVNFC